MDYQRFDHNERGNPDSGARVYRGHGGKRRSRTGLSSARTLREGKEITPLPFPFVNRDSRTEGSVACSISPFLRRRKEGLCFPLRECFGEPWEGGMD